MITFAPAKMRVKTMLIKEVVVRRQESFENAIQKWAEQKAITYTVFDGNLSLTETADAVVLFHEDYNISKENEGVKDLFLNNGKFAHSIDINGTLNASVSSFVFWLENHKPKSLIFIGDDNLPKNEKFVKYLELLSDRI